MNITPTQKTNSPAFTSRLFINVSPEVATKLKKEVLPFYQTMLNRKIAIIDMTVASKNQRDLITKTHADLMNCTTTWLEANARNHGLKFNSTSENHDLFILTGNDIKDFKNYMKKLNSPTRIIFDLLFKNSKLRKESKKYPEHLQKYALDQWRFTKRLSNIYEFLKNNKNYKENKDITDILENLLTENI